VFLFKIKSGIIDIKLTSRPTQAPNHVEAEIEIKVLEISRKKIRILNILIIRKEI